MVPPLSPNRKPPSPSAAAQFVAPESIHARQYSLTVSSENLTAAIYRHGSWDSQRRHHHKRSNMSSLRMVRSAPPSPAEFHDPKKVPHFQYSPASFRNSYHEFGTEHSPVPRLKLQMSRDGLLIPTNLVVPRTRSVHSSNSSRSAKSHQNYSYPRNHSGMSEHNSIPESGHHHQSPYATASELGGDGQLDRFRQRMGRSKSTSTDYSPEAFWRFHGGVIPNMELDSESGSRARPPITSRTSSHYSKLADPVAIPAANVTRRSSYSSATGISPVAEGYVTNFSNTSIEPQNNILTRTISAQRALIVDTRVSQVDGALNSPMGPGSVPESPMGPGGLSFTDSQFYPTLTLERKRVDDFDFLNTFEASARPYTPDQFAVEAGMLNKDASTTRNSSQRSKRSLASFGGLSKKSGGHSYTTNHSVPVPASRNVLRKKNPSLKSAQMDGNDFNPYGSVTKLSQDNSTGFLDSLRGRPQFLQEDEYSADMPHTATTCAGPSRGLIKEGSYMSLNENTNVPNRTKGSRLSLAKLNPFSKAGRERMSFMGRSESAGKGPKHSNTFANTPTTARTTASYIRSSPGETFPPSSNGDTVSSASIGTRTSSLLDFANDGNHTPSYYVSTIYSEGKQVLRQAWNQGWAAAMDDLKERRDLDKSYRYGSAGKKIKMYMHGALPNGSLAKTPVTSGLAGWKKSSTRAKRTVVEEDEQHGFQGGLVGKYVGGSSSKKTSAEGVMAKTDGAGGDTNSVAGTLDKKSAFTEMFERGRMSFSRERTQEIMSGQAGSKTPVSEKKKTKTRKGLRNYLGR